MIWKIIGHLINLTNDIYSDSEPTMESQMVVKLLMYLVAVKADNNQLTDPNVSVTQYITLFRSDIYYY